MARKKMEAAPQAEAPEPSPLEMAALAQVAKGASKARDLLVQGKGQPVDFTVRVAGAVTVGPDHEASVNEQLDLVVLLGLVLERLPERTRGQVLSVAHAACEEWADNGALPEVGDVARDQAVDLLSAAKRKASQQRRGAVTASLSLTLVQRGQRLAA